MGMERARVLAGSVLLGLLAACTNPVALSKPGVTQKEYARDKQVCEDQADRAAQQQLRGAQEKTQVYNRVLLSCMRARGYELQG